MEIFYLFVVSPGADGQQQLSAMGDAIRDPIRHEKPLIMFAGEHTTPFHPSTMHGAFLSGKPQYWSHEDTCNSCSQASIL
jgi:hypothetical protein